MHTPSEDESGTTPLAVARAQARAKNPLAAISAAPAAPAAPAESGNGADANGSNGHRRPPEQVSQPRFKLPRLSGPRLSGPWLRRLILVAWPVGLDRKSVV